MTNSQKYTAVPEKIIYLILIVSIISLAVSSFTLYELKKTTKPVQGIAIDQFLAKLTDHTELADYKGIPPSNIVRVENTNLANLQAQINGLDTSFIGSYIVQYTDRLFIYNLESDKIMANIPLETQPPMPNDLFTKLLQHPELKGTEQSTPRGGLLDEESLQALKQQLPDVYKDAQAGDYLFRYPDRLVIYNYQQDKIINAVSLQQ